MVLSMAAAPDVDVGTVMESLATEAINLWQEVSKRNQNFFGLFSLYLYFGCHKNPMGGGTTLPT